MNFLKKPFQLGHLTLPNNILYAPLAGCSDFPFRSLSARFRPGIMFCEMVKMDALVRGDPGTFHLLDYDVSMHPIGGQIVGSKPQIAGQAAKIIEDLGFDAVDFNCGCPVDKVTKDGSGSAMLKTPELIGEILCNMVAAVKIPVTVKIRAGWDESTINAPLITEIAEKAGAVAITIHGRTRKQGYNGPANWDWIRDCKSVAKNILVIGNGDVLCGPSAEKIFTDTGCDAVLVSRGTMGRPWVVEDIISHLSQETIKERSIEECRQIFLDHFLHIVGYQNERKAVVDARRIGCYYFKKARGNKAFRNLISRVGSTEDAIELIRTFPIGEGPEEIGEEIEVDCV